MGAIKDDRLKDNSYEAVVLDGAHPLLVVDALEGRAGAPRAAGRLRRLHLRRRLVLRQPRGHGVGGVVALRLLRGPARGVLALVLGRAPLALLRLLLLLGH